MDKEALLELVRIERGLWEGLIASLDADQMLVAGAPGSWSVKNIVAHITWLELETADMIRAQALVGSELWQLPPYQTNEALFQASRTRELGDILAEAAQVHKDLYDQLLRLDEEDRVDPARFAGMSPDWQPWQVTGGNTHMHYCDHRQDVRVWLATGQKSAL